MRKIKQFLSSLIKEIIKDDVISNAHGLTFKLLLAIFPFAIFLINVLSFLKIDGRNFLISLRFPIQMQSIANVFITEILTDSNIGILSSSLIVTIISASSGFRAIVFGINKSYGNKEIRTPVRIRLISIGLVFLFTLSIAVCFFAIIFGGYIMALFQTYYATTQLNGFLAFMIRSFGTALLLLLAVGAIYRVGSCKRVKFISVLPGAFFTVIVWFIASKIFNIYVENFAKFSVIYGSLASIFIFMLWLNIISLVLLIGSEINALLDKH